MKNKVLITSALPYANGPLHFGHIAGAYLPADCYARFSRLLGAEVLYVCGSDEYGVAITLSADLAKRDPQAHVDIFHAINQDLFKKLHFSFDHYSRTTWPGHVSTVQQFFKDLLENGYIEERITEQLYSEKDKRFLADRYVQGGCPKCGFAEARGDECQKCGASYEATDLLNPLSKLTGSPLIRKETKHWFLRFDLFKDKLTEFLAQKEWKSNVIHFARSYVDDLKPRAITRDAEWGIPVPLPGAEGKVLYVWFDAPIGYISATKEWAEKIGDKEAWKRFWLDEKTRYVQFIGKDNIPFHAVFFPAMEMGQNIPYKLVDDLPANEFLNLEGKQFSKSDGWMIDLESFFHHFTADQIRYVLAANAPESQDAEFTWKDFQTRCNSELLGKLGNLANRLLVFIRSKAGGKIPPAHALDEMDLSFRAKMKELFAQAGRSYEGFHLRKAASILMEMVQEGNVYFDAKKPWSLFKQAETLPQMETVLHNCLLALRQIACVAFPIIPKTAEDLFRLTGAEGSILDQNWQEHGNPVLEVGRELPEPFVLFKRVEDEQIEAELAKLKSRLG